MSNLSSFSYLLSAVLFIFSLKGLSSPKIAIFGNLCGITGMALAVLTTFFHPMIDGSVAILIAIFLGGAIGTFIALKIKMTAMPQLVAGFHSLVGLAAVLISASALLSPQAFSIIGEHGIYTASKIEMSVGAIVGAITFSGSIVAFLKLQGLFGARPVRFTGQHIINLLVAIIIITLAVIFVRRESKYIFLALVLFSFLIGYLLIIPIGGADMPVIVSMLNSYSGWAAAGIGFTLNNSLLIITGALVGSSGAILSYIMCKAMNRSILNVIFGGFGSAALRNEVEASNQTYKTGSAEDAAYLMSNANSVIIVPGYGMAVAQAQHSLKIMCDILKKRNVSIKFAIHPVAGRMPGHMNVLLAEANIDYDDVFELERINGEFKNTDVAFVIGANDVTNPAAKTDPKSPIYGMPVLNVADSKSILFVKRSMAAGYSGVENSLFYLDNTSMLFGDAKKVVEDIIKELEQI